MKKRDRDRPEVELEQSSDPVPVPPMDGFNPTQNFKKLGLDLSKFSAASIASHSHSGPLPHPSLLAEYNDVMPGLAERIVQMAEGQFEHRVARERDSLAADIFIAKRTSNQVLAGQVFSFVISMSAIIAGAWVAAHGQPWVAGAFGTGGIAGLVIGVIQSGKHNALPPPPKKP